MPYRNNSPVVSTRSVFCVRCERRVYQLGFDRRGYAVNAACPECSCRHWSMRDRAAVEALVNQWIPLVRHVVG